MNKAEPERNHSLGGATFVRLPAASHSRRFFSLGIDRRSLRALGAARCILLSPDSRPVRRKGMCATATSGKGEKKC